jgi:hypothetical protein
MLGKFDIHEIVAQSAESVVFAGEEMDSGAPLALRRYLARSDGERGAGDGEGFFAEVEKVRGLEDPHAVGILSGGFDQQDGYPYFFTRPVAGDQLVQMLGGSRLAEADAGTLVEEALEGLAALHERGLVHGGVRADRLRWSRYAGVCLLDAGMEPALLRLGDFVGIGDEATTAPELRGAGMRTMAGDFYGLGATVYELLTGRPAPAEAGGWPSAGEGAQARWDGWLAKMCAADPGERPTSCAEARELLRAARSTAQPAPSEAPAAPLLIRVAAPAGGAPTPAAAGLGRSGLTITGQAPLVALPSAKRRSGAAAWVAALILCLGVGAGGYFLRHRDQLPILAGGAPAPAGPEGNLPTAPPVTPPASVVEPAFEPAIEPAIEPPPAVAVVEPVVPGPVVVAPVIPPIVQAPVVPEPVVEVRRPDPPVRPVEVAADPAVAARGFFTPRDEGLMLAQVGKPGVIRGVVKRVGGSTSGAYMDIQFHGGEGMAFIRVPQGAMINVNDFQVFKGQEIEVRGVIDRRPWTNRDRPSVRFLSIADITVVPR